MMICRLVVCGKTWYVYGSKMWIISAWTEIHLIQLLERSSSEHCPDYCASAVLNSMNSGDCYMKKERENHLP